MTIVRTDTALDAFRSAHLGGTAILDKLKACGGKMLVSVDVGVGKSTSLDAVTEEAVRSGRYDLVVVLCPTRRILRERRWVHKRPKDVDVRVLKPRPAQNCGPALDHQWQFFEQQGLGLLGRAKICGACPHQSGCFWPRQYGKSLRGAQVIFATQAHLERDPHFISQLIEWTAASRVLVILDENDAMLKNFERRICKEDLRLFASVLDQIDGTGESWDKVHAGWKYFSRLLLCATGSDLCASGWLPPRFPTSWALRVQEFGYQAHGERFCFLAHDVAEFGRSAVESRERCDNGDLRYAAQPRFASGTDVLVYSGTCIPEFARFRLGIKLPDPYGDHRFVHPGTTWFNIASSLGARKYFEKNAPQILDFFAGLVARRHSQGRRPLLVSKKCFVKTCAAGMIELLRELGWNGVRVVFEEWESADLADPNVIPLIHYGMIGTNLFEDFDCAFCLNSFNVDESVIDHVLQDVMTSDGYIPLRIQYAGRPLRRTVSVVDPAHRVYDVQGLARLALIHKEMDVVVQAVGRVRPYTKPREIITFQCAEHPRVKYAREFTTLEEARLHFGILARRERQVLEVQQKVRAACSEGMTQLETMAAVNISLRTVQRHWPRPATSPLLIHSLI